MIVNFPIYRPLAFAAFLLCTIALPPAYAGGSSMPAKVLHFQRAADLEAVVVLRFQGSDYFVPAHCNEATIYVRFVREPFWRRTWSKELVTEQGHRTALKVLERAARIGNVIHFGSMGTGLVAREDTHCEFSSNGLEYAQESGGNWAVYSYHDPI